MRWTCFQARAGLEMAPPKNIPCNVFIQPLEFDWNFTQKKYLRCPKYRIVPRPGPRWKQIEQLTFPSARRQQETFPLSYSCSLESRTLYRMRIAKRWYAFRNSHRWNSAVIDSISTALVRDMRPQAKPHCFRTSCPVGLSKACVCILNCFYNSGVTDVYSQTLRTSVLT